jgi:hypothetical protein
LVIPLRFSIILAYCNLNDRFIKTPIVTLNDVFSDTLKLQQSAQGVSNSDPKYSLSDLLAISMENVSEIYCSAVCSQNLQLLRIPYYVGDPHLQVPCSFT